MNKNGNIGKHIPRAAEPSETPSRREPLRARGCVVGCHLPLHWHWGFHGIANGLDSMGFGIWHTGTGIVGLDLCVVWLAQICAW